MGDKKNFLLKIMNHSKFEIKEESLYHVIMKRHFLLQFVYPPPKIKNSVNIIYQNKKPPLRITQRRGIDFSTKRAFHHSHR